MIQNGLYNGIDFSTQRDRDGSRWLYDYQNQRVINKILVGTKQSFIFKFTDENTEGVTLTYLGSLGTKAVPMTYVAGTVNIYTVEFEMDTNLGNGVFRITNDDVGEFWFSEQCEVIELQDEELAVITGQNNNNKFGIMGASPFMLVLDFSLWKNKKYYSDKTDYEYSFGRKIAVSAESNIFDHFTFLRLSQYQANVLRWLSDMQNFTINGVVYQRVSDWVEVADDKTELVDISADFAKVEWSEFDVASKNFSVGENNPSEEPPIFDFLNRIKRINYGITLTPKV